MMDAEDMVQDLFLKLFRVDLIIESTAKKLLFKAAHRMVIDHIRHSYYVKHGMQYLIDNMQLTIEDGTIEQMERNHILTLENRFLSCMPRKRAQVYRLWREEVSMKEIAKQLNISRRTAETHAYLAFHEMKDFIKKAI